MAAASQVVRTRKALAVAASAAVLAVLIVSTQRDREIRPSPQEVSAPRLEEAARAAAPAAEAAAPRADAAAGAPAAEPDAPVFDLVRVTPDGSALVAGHAAPGARVTIAADEAALAEVEAGQDGSFVAMFQVEPSARPRSLTLDAEAPDGTRAASEEAVMLLPRPAEPDPAPAGAVAEAAETPFAEAAGAPGPTPEVEVAATAILRPDAVEVLPAAPVDPTARQVSLASISYAAAGQVTLAGAGTAGAQLRAYVDGDLAREVDVGSDGRWSLDLGDVERGLYRLRIDQLDPDGTVASRVETPFQRDFPIAPRRRPGGGPGVSITVQPGSNLWTIARVHYGSGVLYTQIFTANRDLIQDPDLIYPGQVLALPKGEGAD